MKWRIKRVTKSNGETWYIPKRRVCLLFWRKISVIDFLRNILLPYGKELKEIDSHFALTEPFTGYTYFLTEEDTKKMIELYERHRSAVTTS